MNRFILHCDLDCFFAAVEMRDNPDFKDKPVIIGADPKKGRGVISTCNYEARKFGLHSAMPISEAYRRCPQGIYLAPNGKKYHEVSKEVMKILESYSEDFQQVGGDEAYIDLTEVCSDLKEIKSVMLKIQEDISTNIGITISIGCAPTKSLAKIASDFNKPNGITIFTPYNFKDLIKDLDVTRIPGIGKKSKVCFYKKGFKTVGDIINTPAQQFIEIFGKQGEWIWSVANGLDNRKVKPFNTHERKSISAERTFFEDTADFNILLNRLEDINERIHTHVMKHNIMYKTVSLKIRFEGFITYTRARTLPYPIQDKEMVMKVILNLYEEFLTSEKKVRLIGIKLSGLEKNSKTIQMNILNFALT